MSKILTIPKPCSENWNKMTPTQKGAFCQSCKKEVIDFTNTPKIVLAKKLSKGNNLCGRFKSSQLNTPLPSVRRSIFQRNMALLGYTSLLAIGTPLAAQKTPNPTHQVQGDITMGKIIPTPTVNDSIIIRGNVRDNEYGLPGAIVAIKSTTIKTQTYFDGNFSISVNREFPHNEVTLVVSSLGYQTLEKIVPLKTNFVQITHTVLEEHVLGGLAIERQNIIRLFLNLFRKN